MAFLLLSNIEPGTTDQEIKLFLIKYGFPEYSEIVRMNGDSSRPSARLAFSMLDINLLGKLRDRIHGIFWKGRKISVQLLRERFM